MRLVLWAQRATSTATLKRQVYGDFLVCTRMTSISILCRDRESCAVSRVSNKYIFSLKKMSLKAPMFCQRKGHRKEGWLFGEMRAKHLEGACRLGPGFFPFARASGCDWFEKHQVMLQWQGDTPKRHCRCFSCRNYVPVNFKLVHGVENSFCLELKKGPASNSWNQQF